MPAHNFNIQSLMALVGNSQVVNIASVWYLSVTNSRVVNHNVMLLQQFICQISSEFFIFYQDSTSAYMALEAISFSP